MDFTLGSVGHNGMIPIPKRLLQYFIEYPGRWNAAESSAVHNEGRRSPDAGADSGFDVFFDDHQTAVGIQTIVKGLLDLRWYVI